MRQLKLQMQLTIDGFVCGPKGEMDWMEMGWGDDIKNYVIALTTPVDLILLGRNLANGFIPHWEAAASNLDTADQFTRMMNDAAKVVFSHSQAAPEWKNTEVVQGDVAAHVARLKSLPGGDIIVYGGSNFVSSLIPTGLIDEYHLCINPTAIGKGLRIFTERTNLAFVKSQAFENGEVVLQYRNKT